jgi:single-strand DNA-binding protein
MTNRVILVGRVGRDAETRNTNAGTMSTFSVATSETFKKKDGEKVEKTEWHKIVVFNENLAKISEKICRKGALVYIEGALQTRKWKDQKGEDRYSTEVVLKSYGGMITVLASPKGGGSSDDRDDDRDARSSGGGKSTHDDMDDSIPF